MGFWSAIPVIGNVLDGIFGIIDKSVTDKDKANELKAVLEQGLMNTDLTKYTEQIKAQTSVIVAEAQGNSFLQRNWRPGLMCLFGLIIFNNYVLYPYLSLFFVEAPMLEIPPDMWGLLKLGVGGYVVGRSGEKVVKLWKDKNKQEPV
jgi:hypothetical protein